MDNSLQKVNRKDPVQSLSKHLRIVTHEVSNPLQMASLCLEMLRRNFGDSEEITKRCNSALASLNQARSLLLHECYTAESNERGYEGAEKEIFMKAMQSAQITDLAEKVSLAIDMHLSAADFKKIHLYQEFVEGENLLVKADETKILQVLINIISNALKFSPPGKCVKVSVSRNGHYIRVGVEDEGPGISESDMLHLFRPNARLSAKPTGGEVSNGLGLSIVKNLVQEMNGKVWCESRLNYGTTFFFEIPSF
jgi:signal transduction histidine kinase